MRVALALLAALLVLPCASAQSDDAGVTLRVEPGPRVAEANSTLALDVTISNPASFVRHIYLMVRTPDWMGAASPDGILVRDVPARGSLTARINVFPGLNAPVGVQPLVVRAIDVLEIAKSTSADVLVEITEPTPARDPRTLSADRTLRDYDAGVIVHQVPDPIVMTEWTNSTHTLLVANPTDSPRSVVLLQGTNMGYWVDFVPSQLTLRPNETIGVRVTLSAPPLGAGESVETSIAIHVVDGPGASRLHFLRVRVVPATPPADYFYLAVFGVPITIVGVAIAVARRSERVQWGLVAPLLPLFTRLSKAKVLDNATRDRLLAMVRQRPGIYWHEVKKETLLPTGVLVYHLQTLEKHGFLVRRREGRRLRFFPAGGAPAASAAAEPAPTAAQERILAALAAGPMTQREIAASAGLTQQGVSYHLRNLERKGKIVGRLGEDGISRYAKVHEFRPVR